MANPFDEEDIIGDAEQIQLTNMRASACSGPPSQRHCTGKRVCQFDLQGIVGYRSVSMVLAGQSPPYK